MTAVVWKKPSQSRRHFIGGSDAGIITGGDEAALVRLWREKRGEVEPEDLSGNLVVQLGLATEDLNRRWYEAIAGGGPSGLYIATVCYATSVLSLGWFPWNFLLIGLLFLVRNKALRERARRSGRARMPIGLADGRVVHSVLNCKKTTFTVSRSWR
jgi:hypothetical protein